MPIDMNAPWLQCCDETISVFDYSFSLAESQNTVTMNSSWKLLN